MTTTSKSQQMSEKRERSTNKVLVMDFKNHKLAIFAKHCTQMATCIVNMCPDDPLFSWPVFTEEIERLVDKGRGDNFVASLEEINRDLESRDRLIRFVSKMC